MLDKRKIEQIKSFDGIGIVNAELISSDLRENLEKILECIERFNAYDFGDIDEEMTAANNMCILTSKGVLFGSYDLKKGSFNILMNPQEAQYRFVYRKD